MNKLSVRSQLLLGFSVMLVLLMVTIGFSIYEQNKLATLTKKQYDHPFMVTNAVSRADGNIVRMSRLMKDIAMLKDDAEIVKLSQQVDALEVKVLDDLTFAKSRYLTDPSHFVTLIDLFKSWKPIRDQVIALKREGKGAEAGELTRTAGGPKLAEIFTNSAKIYEAAMKKAESFQTQSTETQNQSFIITLIIGVLTIMVGFFVALMLTRSLNRQLGGEPSEVIAITQQLAAGNFKFSSEHATEGSVLHAVLTLKATLHNLISESNLIIGEMALGKFEHRITGNYSGELDLLKKGVNNTAESVAMTMAQLSELMNGLSRGQFKTSMQVNAEGIFREVSGQALTAMNKLDSSISEINLVMNAMNNGNFDARVQSAAEGDLMLMKTSINNAISTLDQLTEDLVTLANAQLKGDLTLHAKGEYKGRFKSLQDARAASTDKIKEVIGLAVGAAETVSETTRQVAQGSSDLSARVQQQAAALEETSATMNQMAATVQTNTGNAHKVATLAHDVESQANQGAEVMQQTIGAMQSIQESSHKIADIVSLIDGIAFQTNLLALNAAVEAARAGEHGRGFAVVASEVRALAQKSAGAAKDIKSLIEDSVSRVENGTQLAQKSGDMLINITHSVKQVAGMIEEIAAASNEQSAGIGQVHQAIANIDAMTQQNAALVEETTAAAESLNTEASSLRQNMNFFNIGVQMRAPAASTVTNRSTANTPKKVTARALPAPQKSIPNNEEWGEF
jgi:methyl-accepting chemotaxis protein